MTDAEQLEQSFEELNSRHAAEYIGLIWVKSAHGSTVVRETPDGELLYFSPLRCNADAYRLACQGKLWHADDVAQAYNHEAYEEDPEAEMRRVLTLVAATRHRKKLSEEGTKQTMTVGRTYGEIS